MPKVRAHPRRGTRGVRSHPRRLPLRWYTTSYLDADPSGDTEGIVRVMRVKARSQKEADATQDQMLAAME